MNQRFEWTTPEDIRLWSVIDRLQYDAVAMRNLLPDTDGQVEIYVITLPDQSFYIGQHRLPTGAAEDPAYLGSGRRLNELPVKGRAKTQLLRLTPQWANIIEALLVTKYRQLMKASCLNDASTYYTGRRHNNG